MPSAADLGRNFAIRDHLSFHGSESNSNTAAGGLVEMRVTTAGSEATLYPYGAHLTRWVPREGRPAIYLSPAADFVAGRAFRGGVPVLFPWFGPRWDGGPAGAASPAHGFARLSEWTVQRTHLQPSGDVQIEMTLGPSERSRALGYDAFQVTAIFQIGTELAITLSVENTGSVPLVFEEGLHAYFAVSDITSIGIEGLRGSTYIDKRDNDARKVQREDSLRIARDVDQVHVQTQEPLRIHDPGWRRSIRVIKTGSNATVVWNPWSTLTQSLGDLPPDGWRHFVCLEAVNMGESRISLSPGHTSRMGMQIRVENEPA